LGAWISVSCACCVMSSRRFCNGLIICPEHSCQLWWGMCDLETSRMRQPWPALDCYFKENISLTYTDLQVIREKGGCVLQLLCWCMVPNVLQLSIICICDRHLSVEFQFVLNLFHWPFLQAVSVWKVLLPV
jgi:hypothetical protein